jgi:HlyD family secretion protein
MRFRMTRGRWIAAAAGAIVLLLIARAMQPEKFDVETAVATMGPLEVRLAEDGRTRAVDRYVVTSPVAGRLERITLREGQTVAAGDVVARIEPLPLDATTRAQLEAQLAGAVARQRAATANLAQAEAAAQQAARELERRRALAAEGVMTAELVEQYALTAQVRDEERRAVAESTRAAAADAQAMRAALISADPGAGARAAIPARAPGSGTVLRVPERSERIVAPGEPLLEIGDPAALEVIVDVLTADAVRVRPGMPARLEGWGGQPLTATVRRVEPSAFTRVSALGVEEQRVNVILDLDSRPAELGDGYRVEASILVWAGENVLTVPAAALFRGQDGWHAFVVENGRTVLREVRTGERGAGRVQVLDGLAEGETVVLFPSDQLREGVRVR